MRSAQRLGLGGKDVEAIMVAGLLHDYRQDRQHRHHAAQRSEELNGEELKEYRLHPIRGQTAIDGMRIYARRA